MEIPFECVALRDGDELRALRATNKLMFNQLRCGNRWRIDTTIASLNTSHARAGSTATRSPTLRGVTWCTASAKTSRGRL